MDQNRRTGIERRQAERERLAVLEVEVGMLNKEVVKMNDKLDHISTQLTRYLGFIGGIMFIFSGVALTLQIAGSSIKIGF